MIRAVFRFESGAAVGFELRGHAGAGAAGEDIVCAGVSSAAYMTANTLTEICGVSADIRVEDGKMALTVRSSDHAVQAVLKGFFLHMQNLRDDHPDRIEIQVQKVEV